MADKLKGDTDRTRAVYFKYLSPTRMEELDAKVGENGMFCDILMLVRGFARPIIKLTIEPWATRKTND